MRSAARSAIPWTQTTDVGPLATPRSRHRPRRAGQRDAVAAGARAADRRPPVSGRPGNYFPPTVLVDSPKVAGLPRGALRPGRACCSASGLGHTRSSSPTTPPFGLGASVWTPTRPSASASSAELEAGQVFVNAIVASDPRVPFGGVKRSGLRPRAASTASASSSTSRRSGSRAAETDVYS